MHKKKKPIDLDKEGWENYWDDVSLAPDSSSQVRSLRLLCSQDVPQQENSCDCGIFTVSGAP